MTETDNKTLCKPTVRGGGTVLARETVPGRHPGYPPERGPAKTKTEPGYEHTRLLSPVPGFFRACPVGYDINTPDVWLSLGEASQKAWNSVLDLTFARILRSEAVFSVRTCSV